MVYIRNFRPGPIWIAGTVQVMSPMSYMVEILSGHIVRRHLEHIKKRFADTISADDPVSDITSSRLRTTAYNRGTNSTSGATSH